MRLPFRKRKTKAQRALAFARSALKLYASLKLMKAGPRATKRAAKGYAAAKTAKFGAKRVGKFGAKRVGKLGKFVAIPAGLAAVAVVVRKALGGGASHEYSHTPAESFSPPVFPEPTPTVSPEPPPAPAGASTSVTPASERTTAPGSPARTSDTSGSSEHPDDLASPVSTGDEGPRMGDPAAPKSGTTEASPPRES